MFDFKEGDRIVTCGTVAGFHRNGNYYAPKVYEAVVRKKDKVLVWKLSFAAKNLEVAVPGWDATPAALRLARAYARDHGLPFLAGVKNNMPTVTKFKNRSFKKAPTTRKRKDPTTGITVEEPIVIGRFKKIDEDII